MMRILWIHQYFATPAGWGSQRMYEFGRRFAAAGHELDILCCAAYDPSLAGKRLVEVAGMRVHVSGVRYRPHMGFARRVWAFLTFMGFCVRHVLRHGRRYDLVVASSGPLTAAVPALLGKWLWRRPFIFEVLDVWPDAAIDAGMLRNRALQRLSFWLESAAYRQAAHIVTCSDGMTARLQGKGVPGGKISTIPHGSDLALFAPEKSRRAILRETLGVGANQMVVLYGGAMGRGNAVDDVAQVMERTSDDPRLVWWFAGDGGDAGKIRRFTEKAGRARVRFMGTVPHARMVELHQAADVALITFMHEPVFHENSPNKCFDALAAGLPVMFNRSTWLEPWLGRYGCGVVCTSDDAGAEMARALKLLAADDERRRRMGQGARRLAEEVFSRDKLALDFLAVVEKASGLRRPGAALMRVTRHARVGSCKARVPPD